jgi:hypothetical protein
MLKEIQKLSTGNYRIVQEDSGPPFVQFLDASGQWVDAKVTPAMHYKNLEAEVIVQASAATRLEEEARELRYLRQEAEERAQALFKDLATAQAERDYVVLLTGAKRYGPDIKQWRVAGA